MFSGFSHSFSLCNEHRIPIWSNICRNQSGRNVFSKISFQQSFQVGPAEAYPILLGDTDVNGNTTATILHQLGLIFFETSVIFYILLQEYTEQNFKGKSSKENWLVRKPQLRESMLFLTIQI